jgi:AraC-like DNA-binding protein
MVKLEKQKTDFPGMFSPEIISVGRSVFDPIWALKEHSGPYSELLHVLHGQVTIKARSYSIVAREGDTIFTPAKMLHRDVFPLDSVFEVYLIHFIWPEEKKIVKRFSPVQLARATPAGRHEIAATFHQLYQEFVSDLPFSRQLMTAHLSHILLRLCREAAVAGGAAREKKEDFSQARRVQIMTEAKKIIDKSFAEPIALEPIAEVLDLSSYYLSRVFSEESGFTLSSYITRVRMEHAVELLKDPRKNISEVAQAVGFKDSHYFRKVFKAYFRKPPKDFRTHLILSPK